MRIFQVPGRVNLIGEHTDYNDGFVMPAAIDLFTRIEVTALPGRRLSVFSEQFSESVEFDLNRPRFREPRHWSGYVLAAAMALEKQGIRLQGAQLRIHSEVPIGAGLSSSAALEVATVRALLENSGVAMEAADIARTSQRAENDFMQTACGIMDPFAVCCGRAGSAILLDCRSLTYRLVPLPESVCMVVSNTMIRRELAGVAYNERRSECETGARIMAGVLPHLRALRDISLHDLTRSVQRLPEEIYRRCRHVVSENARVIEAAAALENGDVTRVGELMDESHRSLRDDFQVSCDELDLLVDLARTLPGVYGTRMTGAGFGGCTVSLVQPANVEEFRYAVVEGYRRVTGRVPDIYVCSAADGERELSG